VSGTRRLAAILAADVVGYSRLVGADEAGTLARLRVLRAEVGDPLVAELDYFTGGMMEDSTTARSRIGRLFAIARNASFTYCCPAVGTIQHHLVRLNRMDEARALERTILAGEPGLTLAFARRTHRGCTPAFVERRIAALRAAGIPQ